MQYRQLFLVQFLFSVSEVICLKLFYVFGVIRYNAVVLFNVQDRVMLTGRHMVRDVSCKSCDVKLGWIYEYATEDSQRYKEGRIILERALVTEMNGLATESIATSSASSVMSSDNNN